jgi:hypothetical protein
MGVVIETCIKYPGVPTGMKFTDVAYVITTPVVSGPV